jgi:hypothetical protein
VKKKILWIGNSESKKLEKQVLGHVTDSDIKVANAYTVTDQKDVHFPEKTVDKVTKEELSKDHYNLLIMQTGSIEITNFDTTKNIDENLPYWEQEVYRSSLETFQIAERSIAQNPRLEKVIIFKRNFRCDPFTSDPQGIKYRLSEYGNDAYDDIWKKKGNPKNIVISDQNLRECNGVLRTMRFGSSNDRKFDGIHYIGKFATQHYTFGTVNALIVDAPEFVKPVENKFDVPEVNETEHRKHLTFAELFNRGQIQESRYSPYSKLSEN